MKVFAVFSLIISFLIFSLFLAVTVDAFYKKKKTTAKVGAVVTSATLIWAITALMLNRLI